MTESKDKMSRCRYRHPHFEKEDNGISMHCHVDGWENDKIKKVSEEICERCDKFKSRHIEYPITINGIKNEKIEYKQTCCLCKVQPCDKEYEGKTFVGIFLGDIPIGLYSSFREDTGTLTNSVINNPAIFIPKIGKIVFGCNSWWQEIESIEDFSDITEDDIENTWYVQAMKEMIGGKRSDKEKGEI